GTWGHTASRRATVRRGVWCARPGRIARPKDGVFGGARSPALQGRPAAPHHDALRAWVRDGTLPFAGDAEVRARQVVPTPEEQLARTEFTLAWHLHRAGRRDAAERHFVRASELAPHDFTIRRGSMPIRGLDPMGAASAPWFQGWLAAAKPYYAPMPAAKGD